MIDTDHYHCPEHGDSPKAQPWYDEAGRYRCGWCWHFRRVLVEMMVCTPATCPDEAKATDNPNDFS